MKEEEHKTHVGKSVNFPLTPEQAAAYHYRLRTGPRVDYWEEEKR